MNKLRILCLHGFTSNGAVHALQIRSITDALSKDFEFLFPDGPHSVDMSGQESSMSKSWTEYVSANSSSGHRAWWFARDADQASPDGAGSYHGLESSLESLSDLIRRTGEVHGIWGFSQGACFAALLTALLSPSMTDHPLRKHLPAAQGPPTAGVFISGFKARFPQYDGIYAPGIDVPTLHIIGEKDDAVVPEKSESLMKVCRNASVLRHSGGHEIPSSEEDRSVIVKFLRENLRPKERESL